ncbi:MAG: FHA domain-containing protein [Phycisphaerae bacterium]|nr:FHA domain-containing protein [Phycisphaerae bacterium]
MTHEQPSVAEPQQAVGTAEPMTRRARNKPYLRVFGVDIGVIEHELCKHTTTIGRASECDIKLPNRAVSRAHASISLEHNLYRLMDVNSASGTTVNGKAVDSHVLQHGDSIAIATYTLQFYDRREDDQAKDVAAQAKLLLRAEYSPLPETLRARFRVLEFASLSASEANGTLAIGQGGFLIPTSTPPDNASCLELEMTIGGRVTKRVLGEITGVIERGGTHWMCVKLHTISKQLYEGAVAGATPGPWINVSAT